MTTNPDYTFVSYNLLAPLLSDAGWYLHCDPEDCDPETRYGRIIAKLEKLPKAAGRRRRLVSRRWSSTWTQSTPFL